MQTKTISISDIPIVYINLKKDSDKNKAMIAMLKSLGIKKYYRINAVQGKHVDTSLTKWKDPAYASACVKSFFLALSRIPAPFIMLEDDAALTPYFTNRLQVPENADFFYLGLSVYGLKDVSHVDNVKFNAFEKTEIKNVVRLRGMAGGHAIMVLNENARLGMIKKIMSQMHIIQDVSFAQMQLEENFIFFGACPPLFYQPEIKEATVPQEYLF